MDRGPNPPARTRTRQDSIDELLSLFENDNVLETTRRINGRIFHNLEDEGVRYYLPHDRIELNRMETLNFITKAVWKGDYSAPVTGLLNTPETKVLDLGCGGGYWVKDLASQHPLASFIGTDLSSTFIADANNRNKPQNAAFLECNTLNGLPFEDNTFDFVYQRGSALVFTESQWKDIMIPEIVRVLKPGGFVELHEVKTIWERMGPFTTIITKAAAGMMRSREIDPSVIDHFEKDLGSTGELVDITRKQVPVPVGEWGGKLGELFKIDRMKIAESIETHLAAQMNVSHEKFEEMLRKMFEEEVNEHKTYLMSVRVYAQKISKASSSDSGIGTLL